MKTALHLATESLWRNMAAARAGSKSALASVALASINPNTPPRVARMATGFVRAATDSAPEAAEPMGVA